MQLVDVKNTHKKTLYGNTLNVYSLSESLQRVELKHVLTSYYNLSFDSP